MGYELITEVKVAAILGVHKDTVRKWRRAGDGPVYVQVGRQVRYNKKDVEIFLKIREVKRSRRLKKVKT